MFINSQFKNLQDYRSGEIFVQLPKEKKLLAFVGPRKSGKTTASKLAMRIDDRFKLASFADPLRQLYSEVYKVSVEDLVHTTKKEKYRQGLVDLSKQVKEDKGLFYFAEEFFNSYGSGLKVCDDMRYLEELYLGILFGAVVYRVYCPDHMRVDRGWIYDPSIDEDRSETELSITGATLHAVTRGFGGTIFNTRKEDYMEQQLIPVLKDFFPHKLANPEFLNLEKIMSLEM